MALPGAVLRRTERERDELRGQGIDPDSGMPVAQQTGEAPASPDTPTAATPTPAPAGGEDPAALRAKIAELEAAVATQNGRTSTTAQELTEARRLLDTVQQNRSFLENQLTTLTEQVQNLQQANEKLQESSTSAGVERIISSLDGAGLSPEQVKEFGQDSVDFVTILIKQHLAAVMKPLVERLAALEKGVSRVKEIDGKLPQLEASAKVASLESARSKELEFLRTEVIPYYPTFEKDRATPEWKDFLQKEVPGRGFKYMHLLQSYRETSNAVGIRTILEAFYTGFKSTKSLDSLAVPAKTNADAPPSPKAPKIKASEYKQKLRDFIAKKLPKAEWDAFRARWEEALPTGNVDMDVEIR